ncbi:MAG: hypothetical protein R3185_02475, partial [Candidatus Thermoplasmatota archaeon]|nr:hypothetical protein [Candidatus Thermoplasmatota archaeon]
MRVELLAIVLLLSAGLAGCLAEEHTRARDGMLQTATSDQAATLPPGLTMEGAEEVSYNETAVSWAWTGVVPPATGSTGLRAYAATVFEV